LEEAFDQWSEEARPASILHVHYYHDLESHLRGYQVVYEEPWMPCLSLETPKEEEPARLLFRQREQNRSANFRVQWQVTSDATCLAV
jgi:hypothetical protein